MEKFKLYRACEALRLTVCAHHLQHDINDNQQIFSEQPSGNASEVFRVSISDDPPWSFESPPGSGCFCGVSVTVLAFIGQQLGLRFLINAEDRQVTQFTPDGTKYYGATAELLSGLTDISVTSLSVTSTRLKHFEMISGYVARNYKISVHGRWLKESDITRSILDVIFYRALVETWPAMLLAVACICIALTLLRQSEKNDKVPSQRQHRNWFWSACLKTGWEVAASFFSQGDIKRPRRFAGATVPVVVWLLYSYFATTIMFASITSSLAGSTVTPPFHTLQQFVDSDYYPLLLTSTSPLEFMKRRGLEPLLNRTRKPGQAASLDDLMAVATNLSRTDKIAVFSNDEETPVYKKMGFIPAIESAYQLFISMYQLPIGSDLGIHFTALVEWMGITGNMKPILELHKDIMYMAYDMPSASGAIRVQEPVISIGLKTLVSTVNAVLGLLGIAIILLCSEIAFAKFENRY